MVKLIERVVRFRRLAQPIAPVESNRRAARSFLLSSRCRDRVYFAFVAARIFLAFFRNVPKSVEQVELSVRIADGDAAKFGKHQAENTKQTVGRIANGRLY